jgi:hypothetical protein
MEADEEGCPIVRCALRSLCSFKARFAMTVLKAALMARHEVAVLQFPTG